jgi:flavin-dependent dehydrogenase
MSTRNVDVVIVGAGLGGATAVIALAQRGVSVALFESSAMPRHKVCGEFLSPEIRAIFTRLKLSEEIENAAERINNTRIVSAKRVLETPLPSSALALSRFRLDEILWNRAVEAGALCFDQTRVRDIKPVEQDGFVLSTRNDSWRARYVVVAAGRNARVAQNDVPENTDSRALHVGFKTHFEMRKSKKALSSCIRFAAGIAVWCKSKTA